MTRLMMFTAAFLFGSIGAEGLYAQTPPVTLQTHVTNSSSQDSGIVLVANRYGQRYSRRPSYRPSYRYPQRDYSASQNRYIYPSYRYGSPYYGDRTYYGNRNYYGNRSYYGNRGYGGGVRVGPVQVWW